MEPIPIRIHENTKEALEYEAADRNISVSAHTRSLLQKGREFDSDEYDDDDGVVVKYTTGGSQQNVSQLRAMTLRVKSSTEDQLKSEAADNDTDLSEHIRDLIAKGRAQEELEDEEQAEQAEQPDAAEADQDADEADVWEESNHENDHAKMDSVSIELTVTPETKNWLQEQATDSDGDVAAVVQQLVAQAREDDTTSEESDQNEDTEPLVDRVASLEDQYESVADYRADTDEKLDELSQRVTELETRLD